MNINSLPRLPLRTTGILTLGILSVVGSFALGIRTAGDVKTVASLSAENVGMAGDINDNGLIDAEDVKMILEIAQGYRSATPAELLKDPNGDGSLSVDDALALLHDIAR